MGSPTETDVEVPGDLHEKIDVVVIPKASKVRARRCRAAAASSATSERRSCRGVVRSVRGVSSGRIARAVLKGSMSQLTRGHESPPMIPYSSPGGDTTEELGDQWVTEESRPTRAVVMTEESRSTHVGFRQGV